MNRFTRRVGLLGAMLMLVCAAGTVPAAAQDYRVTVDPADFVMAVDNPYFPHLPGMTWAYESQTADGLEHTEIEVLPEKREVMGVTTTVTRDTVTLDGVVIEDTLDFFAQDIDGNVWYFGEDVQNFEGGQFVSSAGSWLAGVDGALPGIVMFGDPASHLGETYRQEYFPGEAEDEARLLSNWASITIPYGAYDDVVLTYDFTMLESNAHEVKYFAPGIGEIRSVDLVTGEESMLIRFASS